MYCESCVYTTKLRQVLAAKTWWTILRGHFLVDNLGIILVGEHQETDRQTDRNNDPVRGPNCSDFIT